MEKEWLEASAGNIMIRSEELRSTDSDSPMGDARPTESSTMIATIL